MLKYVLPLPFLFHINYCAHFSIKISGASRVTEFIILHGRWKDNFFCKVIIIYPNHDTMTVTQVSCQDGMTVTRMP